MSKHTSFVLISLSIVWIILAEDLSWRTLAVGFFVAMLCMYISNKFMPFGEISNINFTKLIFYPFYLLWQIFLSGFYVARLVVTDSAKAGIVSIPLRLKNETTRVMLMYSMILTPGSIPFEIENDNMKLLWLHDKKVPNEGIEADKLMKIHLENKFLAAEEE